MGWMDHRVHGIIGHSSSKRTFGDNNLLQAGTGCTTANLTYLEEQQTFEAEWPQASFHSIVHFSPQTTPRIENDNSPRMVTSR